LKKIDWEGWLKKPGLPDFWPNAKLRTPKIQELERIAADYIKLNGESSPEKFAKIKTASDVCEVKVFLDYFINHKDEVTLPVVRRLKADFEFHNTSKHNEVLYRWFIICLRVEMRDIFPKVQKMLSEVGRIYYLKPLYQELIKVDRGFAEQVFGENMKFYQAITIGMLKGKSVFGQ